MKRLFAATLALLLALAASGQNRFKLGYGPWVTNVTETGFTVLWTTPQPSLCWVEVAPDDGTTFYAEPRKKYYQTVAGRNVQSDFHSVRIDGLEPGHSYRYRIYGQNVELTKPAHAITYGPRENAWIEPSVKTLDSNAKACRFTMLNDIHNKLDQYSALLEGKTPADMDFLLLNGDVVSFAPHRDTVIKYSFLPATKLVRSVPVVFARGNHESRGDGFADVPAIFPTPTGEFYYSFRQGPAAFLVLDGGEDKPDDDVEYSGYAHFDEYRAAELEWLKKAVKDPSFTSAPVKIVLIHIPPRNHAQAWYTERWIHDNFLPVLNEAGIDAMFCGHIHKYSYNKPGTWDNNFPIIVNSNVERLDVEVTASEIKARIFDADGKETHSHKIAVK
ncbi:MAG: metallophosphoesterase [Bacteroidales bacterium]|nr:metallophosphoesterase [Candidatus Cryptobacteroides equifaecalis]